MFNILAVKQNHRQMIFSADAYLDDNVLLVANTIIL